MGICASIKAGDIDLSQIIGLCPADGWVANFSTIQRLSVLFWVLLRTGEIVGLVGEEPNGKTFMGTARAADKMENFTNYWRP